MGRFDRARPVAVRILHPVPDDGEPQLVRLLGEVRRTVAEHQAATFERAGAADVRIVQVSRDGASFGRRLAGLRDELREDRRGPGGPGGLVVLGSGSVPLLRSEDARRFVEVAADDDRVALANNAYSADIVAIARVAELPDPPDLPSDNALPRWLAERAGWRVGDLRHTTRLGLDIDSPLDAVLIGLAPAAHEAAFEVVRDRLSRLTAIAQDERSELVVVGRTSATSLAMLERRTRCRVRAIVEERGLRASTALALDGAVRRVRPPRSLLGLLLDRDGPAALGTILAELGDAAVVDTRVLLAHRLGVDESAWPTPADRFASDLLDASSVVDPWLSALTGGARDAPIPVLLGGHSLVGPGLGLALGIERVGATRRRVPTAR